MQNTQLENVRQNRAWLAHSRLVSIVACSFEAALNTVASWLLARCYTSQGEGQYIVFSPSFKKTGEGPPKTDTNWWN